jgi:ATP-dependent Zn protease
MTAAALTWRTSPAILYVAFGVVITKFMGESASKLRCVFEAMYSNEAVYLFDEFDAIGARRDQINDVGEIRSVLNSFLQLLDGNDSRGLIIAATNHPDLLDPDLFRRFDDVIEYAKPDDNIAHRFIPFRSRLSTSIPPRKSAAGTRAFFCVTRMANAQSTEGRRNSRMILTVRITSCFTSTFTEKTAQGWEPAIRQAGLDWSPAALICSRG